MPAEVESLAYVREVPWHRIGTRVEELMTAEEAIKAADLDWKVVKKPIYFDPMPDEPGDPRERVQEVPDRFVTVRDRDDLVLGVVGGIYEPLQNRESFLFADSLVDSGEAKYDTAGSLRGGRVVFLAMKFPADIKVAGEDPIDLYGVLWNSHDGTKAITCMVTPIRPVCMNTLQLGLARARTQWSVKHVGSLEGRLAEARQTLQLTFAYTDVWVEEMDRLAQQSFSDSQFEKLTDRLTGVGTKLGERWAEGLLSSWETGPSRGTHKRENRYDAFNAVTEYADWLREPRSAVSQVEATLFGNAMRLRKRAYNALTEADDAREPVFA